MVCYYADADKPARRLNLP